ncbi:MAG TPA: hypothetical protein VGX23_12620 [Actinocrinis sp.]|nr:hypothetical protein [Actinocrinis sp.]
MDEPRRALTEGRLEVPRAGEVRASARSSLPFVVVDGGGNEIQPVSAFLRDLMLSDGSPLTARS